MIEPFEKTNIRDQAFFYQNSKSFAQDLKKFGKING